MLTAKQMQDIIEHSQKIYNELCERYNLIAYPLAIQFTLRGTTAGRAFNNSSTNERRITYNPYIAATNYQEFVYDTIPHEVAHIIQVDIDPRSQSHGELWKSIMRGMGLEANRCHSMDASNVKHNKVKRFVYSCDLGCIYNISAKRHNKIQNGAVYTCKHYHVIEYTGKFILPE